MSGPQTGDRVYVRANALPPFIHRECVTEGMDSAPWRVIEELDGLVCVVRLAWFSTGEERGWRFPQAEDPVLEMRRKPELFIPNGVKRWVLEAS